MVTDELMRLRRLATRMLLLASAGSPDFLHLEPVALESVAVEALDRWGHIPRRWRLTATAEATVLGRPRPARDARSTHCSRTPSRTPRRATSSKSAPAERTGTRHPVGGGLGLRHPAADLERIFHRFARSDPHRTREAGGFGLGLAIVQAIAEAHHGSARASQHARPRLGVRVLLPVGPASSAPDTPAAARAHGGALIVGCGGRE